MWRKIRVNILKEYAIMRIYLSKSLNFILYKKKVMINELDREQFLLNEVSE